MIIIKTQDLRKIILQDKLNDLDSRKLNKKLPQKRIDDIIELFSEYF